MSSYSAPTFLGIFPTFSRSSGVNQPVKFLTGARPFGAKDEQYNFNFSLQSQCNAVSKPHSGGQVFPKNGLYETVEDVKEAEGDEEVFISNKIKEGVNSIRSMLGSMDDGVITASAYDTAWVAFVEDITGSGAPQFLSALEWIANNQLPDGSWGDRHIFLAHDRILNTLACVIALRLWKIHPHKSEKGMSFIKENIWKLEDENEEHMLIGFEVAFPSLLDIARKLDIEVFPDDSPILEEIYARRNLKFTRIPKDLMHNVPTTLLHSLEGMPDLDWEKLLKLQFQDGSFLFSPSATAFALMQTKDDKCLRYLTKVVERFNGGVPNVYPVDLFEHIWVVDRLQRLGISRYFQPEIKKCVDYVYRHWDEEGICWARDSLVHDIDDTAMAFRLLRLHGYQVSADVFQHFENSGEFFCFAGQSSQAVTGIFNLYRASQLLFPGEDILEDAKIFSFNFLREKQARNDLLDKWIITKDLPGEVRYGLDLPWYASLPRVETRFYVEHYGGEDDVWIGKTIYRMPYVNNNTYLELAKLDYNYCQAMHQLEWNRIRKWYSKCNLGGYGMSQISVVLLAYYLATASIFEPQLSTERNALAKTITMVESVISYFEREEAEASSEQRRRAFVHEFRSLVSSLDPVNNGRYKTGQGLVATLIETINQLSLDTLVTHGRDIHHDLRCAWEIWMLTWQEDGDMYKGEAELLVCTINLCRGYVVSAELLSHPLYQHLSNINNKICHQLRHFQYHKIHGMSRCEKNAGSINVTQIESNMQELVQLVLCDSFDGPDPNIKQTFLLVAKIFFYTAYCDPWTINDHISKVLFERVL